MKRILAFSILCLSVAGCCTVKKYDKLLDSRLGMTEGQLVEQLGNPSSVYSVEGKKYLEYHFDNMRCSMYGCSERWCKTRYTVEKGKVSTWSHTGNRCCIK